MEAIHFVAFDTKLQAPVHHTPFNVTMLGGTGNKSGRLWQKHYHYHKFSAKQNANDLIVYFDARDVLFVGKNIDVLITRFKKINASVVIGAEFGCFPRKSICHKKPFLFPDPLHKFTPDFVKCDWTCTSHPGYKFLNSGFIMGRANDLNKVWLHTNYTRHDYSYYDDQEALNKVYALHRQKLNIKLDYDARLVLNLQRMTDDSILYNHSKIYSKLFNHSILFLHGNGDGKQKIKRMASEKMKYK